MSLEGRDLRFVWFTLGFFAIHLVSYTVAGVVSQLYSKELYRGPDAVLEPMLRDVYEDETAQRRQGMLMVPAQLARAVLMAAVLFPLLDALGELSVAVRAVVLGGLMFVYADLAAATPFPNTIEGWVFLKPRYLTREAVWKISSEAAIYSVLFGVAASVLLF